MGKQKGTPKEQPKPKAYGYIPDGYTLSGKLKETAFFPEVEFDYRPATNTERSVLEHQVQKLRRNDELEKAERLSAEFVAEHLVSWSLTHPATGEMLAIETETVLRLEPWLGVRLYQIVTGYSKPDEFTGKTEPGEDPPGN